MSNPYWWLGLIAILYWMSLQQYVAHLINVEGLALFLLPVIGLLMLLDTHQKGGGFDDYTR